MNKYKNFWGFFAITRNSPRNCETDIIPNLNITDIIIL